MSDAPGGPDWEQGNDEKWYQAGVLSGAGWWRASDGRWYPPHLQPSGPPAAPAVPAPGPSPAPPSPPAPAVPVPAPNPAPAPSPTSSPQSAPVPDLESRAAAKASWIRGELERAAAASVGSSDQEQTQAVADCLRTITDSMVLEYIDVELRAFSEVLIEVGLGGDIAEIVDSFAAQLENRAAELD